MNMLLQLQVEKFYNENQDKLEKLWCEYCVDKGLDTIGEDGYSIKDMDSMFWEFVEEQYYKEEGNDI